ncbi:MAG: YkoP family protein, partial [Bacteroidota bacterium]
MLGVGILRKIGEKIDARYQKKVGAVTIPGSLNNLLLVCYHNYQGKREVITNDGVTVNPGDPVGELHFNNKRITELAAESSERSMEWRLIEILKAEFAALAEASAGGLIPGNIRAFYGVNVLAAGAKRMGFTLVPIAPGWNRW